MSALPAKFFVASAHSRAEFALGSKQVSPIEPSQSRHHIEVSIPTQKWKTVLAAQSRNPKVIRWNRLSSLSQPAGPKGQRRILQEGVILIGSDRSRFSMGATNAQVHSGTLNFECIGQLLASEYDLSTPPKSYLARAGNSSAAHFRCAGQIRLKLKP